MALSMSLPSKKRTSLGIDISAEHIKIISLTIDDNVHLNAYAFFKRTNTKAIQDTLKIPSIRSSDVRVSIDDFILKIHKLDLPKVPEQEMREVVRWGLKKIIKEQIENYAFCYYPVPVNVSENHAPCLVFAVEKEKLKQLFSELKQLGIPKPKIVEPQIFALTHSVLHNYSLKEEDRYALIDFGKFHARFAVVSTKGILFYRVLSGCFGDALTSQIAWDLGLKDEDAEKIKINLPSDNSNEQIQILKNITTQFITKVSVEIQRSLETYQATFPEEPPVTTILLTGGGSQLEGLSVGIEDKLKISTKFLNAFLNIDTTQFTSESLKEKKLNYGAAVGLAL